MHRSQRLSTVVKSQRPAVLRFLSRMGLSAADAEDGAQRALFVLSSRIDDVEEGSERAFLFAAARRVASEMRRSRSRSRLHLGSKDEVFDGVADDALLPDEALEQKRTSATLGAAIDQMPDTLRDVVTLFLEDSSGEEIARALNIPRGTCASRLRIARRHLRVAAARCYAAAS
jgi:RNA polymerase sigma-70 factor (ECF subfamily)